MGRFCVVIICTFTLLSQEYNTISESWCSNGKNPFSFWNLHTLIIMSTGKASQFGS